MNKSSSSATSGDSDEYPNVTQADIDRATFRVGLKAAPRKQRVTILLDTGLVEYFKAKAGERGYPLPSTSPPTEPMAKSTDVAATAHARCAAEARGKAKN